MQIRYSRSSYLQQFGQKTHNKATKKYFIQIQYTATGYMHKIHQYIIKLFTFQCAPLPSRTLISHVCPETFNVFGIYIFTRCLNSISYYLSPHNYSFSIVQRFSIGNCSGIARGQIINPFPEILFCRKIDFALAACDGSLSCIPLKECFV